VNGGIDAATPARLTMMKRPLLPLWFVLGTLVAVFANLLALFTNWWTFEAMGGTSEFAVAVRRHDTAIGTYFNPLAFLITGTIVIVYLRPIVRYFQRLPDAAPSLQVQQRIISAPLTVAVLGFTAWFLSALFFPGFTWVHFGRWSPELMSQEIISPLVSGFLAATTTYLLVDWIFRTMVVPRVFPAGHIPDVPGAIALGVRGRLLVFLLAVAFTPLFTMLGLVRAAVVRIEAGVSTDTVIGTLSEASGVTFLVYVLLGVGLTLVLARSLIRPLGAMAVALRRVQAGDLNVGVPVASNDEVGILESGVNAMVAALRDKERILQTFGRIVEPSVRDHLLAGNLRLGGELRTASVLFCDLRGFTAIAEQTPPAEMVAALNEFFTAMTAWVRECGGFVDKFIGDAMLVVFGLFDSASTRDGAAGAAAALRCAIGLKGRLAELNSARLVIGQWPFAVSIGIHSGEVLAGTIGAKDRYEYTVIGDAVNVAARLQQLCKETTHGALLSATTYDLARQHGFAGEVTGHDTVILRGRHEPVRVYGMG
jgi:adenylate cyclase